ncbi:hypothetical protein H072_1301 [Dactylellina haptotyla CBS 200.50]|uniref:Uncharacterized protein n=1 Tax=Dactylellina haptotyla (strain CBS 200.50) TaxID=1284197 RepID=S8BYZ4_DACHA|nr:hypothetical protein H072_1301 [Dactylellina haptotyla CBS 200.50]
MHRLNFLLLTITGINAAVIPESSSSDRNILMKRAPLCAPSDAGPYPTSSFFDTTIKYFSATYGSSILGLSGDLYDYLADDFTPRPLDTKAGEVEPVPKPRTVCDPRPNDDKNQKFYPVPVKGSSDCPRRDQDIHFLLYQKAENLPYNNNLLKVYNCQGPSTFDCATDTAQVRTVSGAMTGLGKDYARVLDEIDYQTCLAGLTQASTTYNYLFNDPVANFDTTTSYHSVLHIFNFLLVSATYRGETFDSRTLGAIDGIKKRFAETKFRMERRSSCDAATKDFCRSIKAPLKEPGLIQGILDTVLGLVGLAQRKCVADIKAIEALNASGERTHTLTSRAATRKNPQRA